MSDKIIRHCKLDFPAIKMANIPSASSRWASMDIRVGNCPACGLVIQRRPVLRADDRLSGHTPKGWEDVKKEEHGRIIRTIERREMTLVRLPVTSEHTINLSKPVDTERNRRAVRAYG